jgi:hypothetical protein
VDLAAAPTEPVDDAIVAFTGRLCDAIQHCYFELDSGQRIDAIPFFAGLGVLLKLIAKDPGLAWQAGVAKQEFQRLDLLHRRQAIERALELLSNWPERLQSWSRSNTVARRLVLGRETRCLPYWLETAIRPTIWAHPTTSRDEAMALEYWICMSTNRFSLGLARRLTRRHFDKAASQWRVSTTLTDDEFSRVLEWIDHEIAGTLNPLTRHRLLTDKMLAICVRFISGSVAGAVRMRVMDLGLAEPNAAPDFFALPHSTGQAFDWLRWYASYSTRPTEQVNASELDRSAPLFALGKQRKAMSRSLATCRLGRALIGARLRGRSCSDFGLR